MNILLFFEGLFIGVRDDIAWFYVLASINHFARSVFPASCMQ
jgi:hypothetical protein